FIGSADMMHRNLDRRVEALVRLVAPAHLTEIGSLFDVAMDDNTSTWHLNADGLWERHSTDAEGVPLVDIQDRLMLKTSLRRRPRARR
ncbi:MAG: RNA degradosome polyphosphate kinase, partial [Mycetocola sp.]